MERENFIITKEMEEEERIIEIENEKEMSDMTKKHEEKIKNQKELEDQRHKRLMHLLTKSQFYSQYLLDKIQSTRNLDQNNNEKRVKGGEDKENIESCSSSSQNSSQDWSEEPTKPKKKRSRKSKADVVCDDEAVAASLTNIKVVDAAEAKPKCQERQPKLFQNGSLRDYQLEGFGWLKTLYENGISGILADEMGLGKTVQIIATLCHLIYNGITGPFLIVAPLSTLPNWISEFERFAPKLPTLLYHGSQKKRTDARKEFKILKKIDSGKNIKCLPIIITSYEVAIKDSKFLKNHLWQYLVVDEGHRLKNHKCILAKALNSLMTTNRVILTGTPLQNNLAELWSLLNFLLPEIFDSLDVFESWFEITDMLEEHADQRIVQQEREKQIVDTLHKILNPFLLRRIKADVDLDIPSKRERLVYVPLTQYQMALYEATVKRDLQGLQKALSGGKEEEKVVEKEDESTAHVSFTNTKGRPRRSCGTKLKDFSVFFDKDNSDQGLEKYLNEVVDMQDGVSSTSKGSKSTSKMDWKYIKLQNITMMLRKIVNHPYLIKFPLTEDGQFLVDDGILKQCGKLQVLDQLLLELHQRGHRVLLFSQMTKLLDILEDYLTLRPQFKYKRLDGSLDVDIRRKDIKEFNETKEDFLYLISTRAGGLGINLASADTVIIYDSDWNPQQDAQAQDRCHRIGQTQSVLVLRLVTASTIDEKMVERAAVKRKLEKVIMKAGKFKNSLFQRTSDDRQDDDLQGGLDPEALLQLLRSTDHDRVHRATEGAGGVFTSEELNLLLDRRGETTQTPNDVVVKDANQRSTTELKGVFKNIEEDSTL